MEKLKPSENVDKLAVAREATSKRYQHRAGSDGRIPSQYDITNKFRAPKPTSCKLEATRKVKVANQGSESPSPLLRRNREDYSSDLFDEYEIERISRQLNYYVKLSDVEHKIAPHGGDSIPERDESTTKSKKNRNNIGKGLFMLRQGVLGCASRVALDVVEMSGGRRKAKRPLSLSEDCGMSLAKCRPRAARAWC